MDPALVVVKLQKIAEGAGVALYRGKADGRDVAVKESERTRYALRELAVLGNIPSHPHIVQLLAHRIDGPKVTLVFEYLEGSTLDVWFDSRKPPQQEVRDIFRQLASAVAHLHRHDVAHRDIKPINAIVVAAEQRVVLFDFDIACIVGRTEEDVVCDFNEIVGTNDYMAPEVWAQSMTSSRDLFAADVYSLGVTYYRLLEGVVPYEGEEGSDYLRAILDEPLRPLETVEGRRLAPLIERMLNSDERQRPTVEQVLAALSSE